MKVKNKAGRIYSLRGRDWNQTKFEFLKAEARDMARIAVFDEFGNSTSLPIKDLEWIGEN